MSGDPLNFLPPAKKGDDEGMVGSPLTSLVPRSGDFQVKIGAGFPPLIY